MANRFEIRPDQELRHVRFLTAEEAVLVDNVVSAFHEAFSEARPQKFGPSIKLASNG